MTTNTEIDRSSGRVDLGGRPPRPPTDPDVLTLNASGSSSHVATSASRCPALTWCRSQCTCHVSRQRFMRRRPLPSPGSLRLVPPVHRYYETLRLLAVLLAALRFLRLAIPPLRPSFVPVGLGRGPRINLELVSRVSSRHCDGDGKVSQVPVKPVRSSAMFLRPRCDQARLWVQV